MRPPSHRRTDYRRDVRGVYPLVRRRGNPLIVADVTPARGIRRTSAGEQRAPVPAGHGRRAMSPADPLVSALAQPAEPGRERAWDGEADRAQTGRAERYTARTTTLPTTPSTTDVTTSSTDERGTATLGRRGDLSNHGDRLRLAPQDR